MIKGSLYSLFFMGYLTGITLCFAVFADIVHWLRLVLILITFILCAINARTTIKLKQKWVKE